MQGPFVRGRPDMDRCRLTLVQINLDPDAHGLSRHHTRANSLKINSAARSGAPFI